MSAGTEAQIRGARPDAFASSLAPFAAEVVTIDPLRHSFEAKAEGWIFQELRLFKVQISHARVQAPPNDLSVSISIPLDRPFTLKPSGTDVPLGNALVRASSREMDTDVPNSSVLVANLDSRLVARAAQQLTEVEQPGLLRAEPIISLTSPCGVRFWRQLAGLYSDLKQPEPHSVSEAAIGARRSELVAALVDLLHPNARKPVSCGKADLNRAEEFIAANLGEPISRADICSEVRCSDRSLSRAFLRTHGMGPMRYLRQRRLEAAQRMLLAAEQGEHTVAEIAMACGLHHFGRFSVDYAEAFGEPPSATLSR